MKKLDLFIENNIIDEMSIVYLDDLLLIKYFQHISKIQFDIEKRTFDEVSLMIENNQIILGIYTKKPELSNSNCPLEITQLELHIKPYSLYNPVYVVHKKGEDIKWIIQ